MNTARARTISSQLKHIFSGISRTQPNAAVLVLGNVEPARQSQLGVVVLVVLAVGVPPGTARRGELLMSIYDGVSIVGRLG